MKTLRFLPLIASLTLLCMGRLKAQDCKNLNLTWKADIPSSCSTMTMTMIHDAAGKPYLYVANKEAGLKIYNISNIGSPVLEKTLEPALFDTLDVMNLCQQGHYVYLALGNHFNDKQASGLAIVNVDTPSNAWVTAHWKLAGSKGGSGVVQTENNYAYLGCMGNGMAVLDISDKHKIVQKSVIKPDINFPTASPNPKLYNARGMAVKNSIVYLCFDAGGIRVINCSNPSSPKETGRFSNPGLNGKTRAYNNCQLDDSLLYVGCDYCGVEILNVKDTHNILMEGKWNPYGCPNNNWFNTPVHANELQLDKVCKKLFVATAKSDMYVLDVSDPSQPDSCSGYGGVSNNIGTWGIGLYQNQVYLSFVCSIIPFSSNWTGVKILTFDPCPAGLRSTGSVQNFRVYPNPVENSLYVGNGKLSSQNEAQFVLRDARGIVCMERTLQNSQTQLSTQDLKSGVYFYFIQWQGQLQTGRIVKIP